MTPTPDDEAGRLTEKVMSRFKEYAILLPYEAAYNRMYEHVYLVLSAAFEPELALGQLPSVLPYDAPPAVVRALEFYGDPAAYQDVVRRPPVLVDRGGLARSALRAVGK